MSPEIEQSLRIILARTDGRCHLCRRQVCLRNYGKIDGRGAWERDHSVPRANGGTDHGNNIFAACVSCNHGKQARSSRSARAEHGRTAKPLSVAQRDRTRDDNTLGLGALGALFGALAGPPGALICGVVFAVVGSLLDPEEEA